ncbi:MAG: two-component system response regulator [Chloroflexi bacterium]|nr:MAG: two-component system response regulator [Chloroflexota bacterium]
MAINSLEHARILVVDDEQTNIDLLERILARAGYANVKSTVEPEQVLALCAHFQPDLILLDLHMPKLDGFTILQQVTSSLPTQAYLPILVLTADISMEAKQRALAYGAKDFLTKPLERVETLLRIKNLLETRFLHLSRENENQRLEEKVRERTDKLEQAQMEVLQLLARAAEYRDDDTGHHTNRVGHQSAQLAELLGLPAADVEMIRRAAPLHDIGKIGIPDHILLKPGRLTAAEFEVITTHAVIGANMLSGSQFPILRLAEQIALTHHERWDGSGYPYGLRGDEIPLAGQIVAVVDVFDALTHERRYKPAWSVAEAVAELERQKGRQFAPRVVEAFIQLLGTVGLQGEGAAAATVVVEAAAT